MVALRTSLLIAGDAAGGTAALEGVERELAQTEQAAVRAGDAGQRAGAKLSAGMKTAAAAAGQQRAGLQQLGFQLGDFTTQVSAGTSIAQAFAQQIGQASQAIQLMTGGTSRLASFLAGPWGVALGVALPLLALFGSKLFESGDAAEDAEKKHRSFAEVLGDTKASYEEVIGAVREYNKEQEKSRQLMIDQLAVQARTITSNIQAALSTRQQLQAALELELANARIAKGYLNPNDLTGPGLAFQRRIDDARQAMQTNADELRGLAAGARNAVATIAGELAKLDTDAAHAIEDRFKRERNLATATIKDVKALAAEYARIDRAKQKALDELKASERAAGRRDKAGDAVLTPFIAPVAGTISGRFGDRRPGHDHAGIDIAVPVGTAVRAPAGGVVIEAGTLPGYGNVVFIDHGGGTITRLAHLSRISAAKGSFVDQGAIVGLSGNTGTSTGPHLHQEVRVNGRAVDPLRGKFPTDQIGVRTGQLDALARAQEQATKRDQDYIDTLKRQTEEIGLSAQALRILAVQRRAAEAATPALREQILQAGAMRELGLATRGVADTFGTALANAFDRAGQAAAGFFDEIGQAAIAEARRQADELRRSIEGAINVLDSLRGGRGGGNVGALLGGFATGDFSGARGPLGAILQILNQRQDGKRLIDALGDRLDKLFGGSGQFAKTLQRALEGAGLGLAANNLILGGKGSSLGSQVGGAFGEAAFKKLAPKLFASLGDFAGPLGSIAGGLLGGLVGGLLKKTKTGSATVGAVDGDGAVTGTGGNSASRISGARGLAGGALDSLDRIVAALGGEVGDFSASVGIRNKKFVVDPSGRGRTKGSGVQKFASEGEAAAALLADIIADGAVKGVSAAVQQALRSSVDVEKAVKEALKVQEVELAIGGIGAELDKAFRDFERQAAERLRIGGQYGFDLVKLEAKNAEDRLKLTEQLLEQQVGSLQRLVDDLTFGSLFEGSSIDRRTALLAEVAAAKADADAGKEGAAEQLAELLGQLAAVSKEVFGTTGGFAADRVSILDQARDSIRLANERVTAAQKGSDPALTQTNAALDENNDQNATIIAELQAQNALLAQLAGGRGTFDYTALAALAATS